jgi:ABC-type glycerol-3-phosphate transport system substrate-binding protein
VVKPIADSYLPYKLDQFRHPKTNKVFAFPWQVGVSVMYYRQDILQKLGMSQFPAGWSWDQHEQLAKKAKTDLKADTTWLGDGQSDKDSNLFLQMVWQAGGTFISKDWSKVEVNSPICIAVAKRLRAWWQSGLIFEGSFYTAPLWGAMRTGQLWMTADPSWWILGMRDNISKPEDHVGDWRVGPLPVATAGGARTANEGGGGLAAPAYTANPDLVKAFGAFATTDLHATIPTIQMGTVVAAKTSFTDPASLNITFAPTGDQKVNQVFADLVGEVPSTFFYSASWNEIRHIVTQNLMPIIKGNVEVEPGLAKIADDATKANDRWLKLLEQEKS